MLCFFVFLFFEKNIQVQTKLHIVYIGMLQVTRSNIGFYLYILVHIYFSIITNQTDIYLLLLFTKYSIHVYITIRYKQKFPPLRSITKVCMYNNH